MPAPPTFAEASAVETLINTGVTTAGALAAAVDEMRRYCGWHVYPVWADHEITLTATGGRALCLPTLHLTELAEIVEDGVTLNLDALDWDAAGIVEKRHGTVWSPRRGAVTVTMTHGHASAPDLVQAVIDAAAGAHLAPVGAGNGPEKIGPFEYGGTSGVAFTDAHRAVFDHYRLPWLP